MDVRLKDESKMRNWSLRKLHYILYYTLPSEATKKKGKEKLAETRI
jgi:hypothetical protein